MNRALGGNSGVAVKVLGRKIIDSFKKKHADARSQIDAWVAEAKESVWTCQNDIKEKYATASFLKGNRIIFNIKGNAYRLDVLIAYESGIVLVKRIGTHAEYDKWKFD